MVDCLNAPANQSLGFIGLHDRSSVLDIEVSFESFHEHSFHLLNMNDRRDEHTIHNSFGNQFDSLQVNLLFEQPHHSNQIKECSCPSTSEYEIPCPYSVPFEDTSSQSLHSQNQMTGQMSSKNMEVVEIKEHQASMSLLPYMHHDKEQIMVTFIEDECEKQACKSLLFDAHRRSEQIKAFFLVDTSEDQKTVQRPLTVEEEPSIPLCIFEQRQTISTCLTQVFQDPFASSVQSSVKVELVLFINTGIGFVCRFEFPFFELFFLFREVECKL